MGKENYSVNLIVAVGNYDSDRKGYVIGKDGKIPWRNKNDMKWFKETTINHPVIMGRKTFNSIGKPLSDRANIIITSDPNSIKYEWSDVVYTASSVEDAVKIAKKTYKTDAFIIGGASVYKEALDKDLVDKIYIDYIDETVEDGDTFFDDIISDNPEWKLITKDAIQIEPGKAVALIYEKERGLRNNVDTTYLGLLNDIIENGVVKHTRAGDTLSVFGRSLRFNLKEGLPMLTTKKMYGKGVIHELLWFLKGDTNIRYLVINNVHIWDDDAYRYFLERFGDIRGDTTKEKFLNYVKLGAYIEGTDYVYGDLGPVYGKQWVNWNGHNQIQEIIDTLKNNPDDRRMILSSWNVSEIPDMALPPCHYTCQFYSKPMTPQERMAWAVTHSEINPLIYFFKFPNGDIEKYMDEHNVPKRKLSCMWTQRSVDSLLGLPFNIMSYAVLTYLIAQCVNMEVDELIFNGGDVHIYANHIEGAKKQLERNPHKYALPQLVLNKDITEIKKFTYDDIKIKNYDSYPTIKFELNVGLGKNKS